MTAVAAPPTLRISDDLRLPIDAAVSRFVLIGKSGAGKTNGDTVMAEELIRAGIPVFILDPLGNMWGLRSSADGESAGIPIVIFGGQHADVALGSGWQMARMLAAQRVPAVLDLSDMPIEDQRSFAEQFCSGLIGAVGDVVHVILEEADRFAPNTIGKNPVKTFARTARNKGIGWTFSTQRPQILSPEVIESSSAIVAMKMTGDLAQEAIGKETASRVGKARGKAIIESLAFFKRGEAWFIPDADWLPDGGDDAEAEPQKFRFRLRETFDSARPPKVHDVRREPKVLAAIDLEAFRSELEGAGVEDDDADPQLVRELRMQIANLQQDVADRDATIESLSAEKVVDSGDVEQLEKSAHYLVDVAGAAGDKLAAAFKENVAAELAEISSLGAKLLDALQSASLVSKSSGSVTARGNGSRTVPESTGQYVPVRTGSPVRTSAYDGDLGKPERLILTALAQHRAGCDKAQLGILSGYSSGSGHFNNILGKLRTLEFIGRGNPIEITAAGLRALGPFEPLPTGLALQTWWVARLGKPEAAILSALIAAYPRALSKATLGDRSGYSHTSGHFNNTLGKLRTLKLVTGYGEARAADALFDTHRRSV